MRILGIETSCDETAAAIVEKDSHSRIKLLSNVISTSMGLHAKTGGIIPEQAARQQIKYMLPVINQAFSDAHIQPETIDAIAVTYGPGLIGSLLVGVETAKTLAYCWKKPLIPVNHLIGHIYANFIHGHDIPFPALALIVSGGHTDLVVLKDHGKLDWIGGTRDDAAGEALDKIGRLLNMPYPAGPLIEKIAKKGNSKRFSFPRPMIDSDDFDFSFSGLKTSVFREVQTIKQFNNVTISDLCASVQQAIIDVLIKKTFKAAEKYAVKSLLLCGGVAANHTLTEQFKIHAEKHKLALFVPQKQLCTDNAAMIAASAFFNYKEVDWRKITANPGLYFD